MDKVLGSPSSLPGAPRPEGTGECLARDVGKDWGIWAPSVTPFLRSLLSPVHGAVPHPPLLPPAQDSGDNQLGRFPDVPSWQSCPLWLLIHGLQLQGPTALLLWEIHPSLAGRGSAGESWGGQLSPSAEHHRCLGWEGGNSSSLEGEQRIDTLCSQTQPVPGSNAAELCSQCSHLGQRLGWDHTPEAHMEWPQTQRGWSVSIRASVHSDRPRVTPRPPQTSLDEPLEAQPRALFSRAQAPGADAKGKPGVLGLGTAPEWMTLLIPAFPPHSPPHPSLQSCWTPSIPAAMAGTLWRAEHELCASGRSEFLLGNLPIPPPGSISFPPHAALGYFPAVVR